ncbi:MAG: serine/threonine-protein kinase, partial [Planctomycetaceae bacterium]
MTSPDSDLLLATLIEQFKAAKASGSDPEIEKATTAYPELADELRQLWATVEFLQELGSAKSLQPPPDKPLEGKDSAEPLPRPFGRYELLEVLGRGGMGVVYKARQTALHRIVALKMIRKGESATEAELARFQSEAQSASRIIHPNVVPVLDAGTVGDQPFYVMPLLEGETLSQRLAKASLRQDEAARIVSMIGKAVQCAHKSGLLHRDLKPSNVIFDRAGVPHVSDFGLAKVFDPGSGSAEKRNHPATISGAILGTPSYMAPEQVSRAYGETGPASDVYSLGAILYEMLAGRPPFRAATPMETLLLVLDQEPVRPAILAPNINADLELICLKCLQKRPEMRYSSADDLCRDLDSWR